MIRPNSRWLSCVVVVFAVAFAATTLYSRGRANQPAQRSGSAKSAKQQAANQKSANTSPNQAAIDRGKYLVENVAMCTECHTPRLPNGELDRSRWLQGAQIWIMPVQPDPNWAMRAPGLAGLQGFSDEQAEDVLEHGVGPNGLAIQRPMHIYHMNHDDALAIIAYLKSLPAAYPHQ